MVQQGSDQQFAAAGLARRHWSDAGAIRRVVKEAFEAVGMPGFNPHSFRHALAMLGERTCNTPEEFKAWSQNLGHDQVLTTFSSYGEVSPHRQAQIIRRLAIPTTKDFEIEDAAKRLVMLARSGG